MREGFSAIDIPEPSELNIPFPSWRQVQLDAMEKCLNSKKRFLILDAPTGVGKSGIAMGLHHLLGSARTLITTSTKYLQSQYEDAFGTPTIWGRSNYPCAIMDGVSVEDGPCTIDQGCDHQDKWRHCEYYKAKGRALKAPIAVLNNSYFMHEANHVGAFSDADFLIFDEGHLLESSLMNFVGVRLTFKTLAQYTDRWHDVEEPMQLLALVNNMEPQVHAELMTATRRVSEFESTPESLREYRRLSGLHGRLLKIKHTDIRDWVLSKDLGGVTLVPIVVDDIAEDYAFCHGRKILIMSATILNGEIFGRQLGIPSDQMDFIEAPSPFYPIARQVLFCPVAKLSYKSPESEYTKLLGAINGIMDKHAGQNGIIHCVSFKLRDRILNGLSLENRRRIITHGGDYGPREDAISRLKNTRQGLVLLSPSAEVGLDLPDDEARFAIWAKIPFADLKDKQVAARKELDSAWYIWATLCSLTQGCGRIVRHSADWGITYILDKNFKWILKYHKDLFPQWWLDALHYRTLKQILPDVDVSSRESRAVNKSLGRGDLFAPVSI